LHRFGGWKWENTTMQDWNYIKSVGIRYVSQGIGIGHVIFLARYRGEYEISAVCHAEYP
jgi:hypothetical protein